MWAGKLKLSIWLESFPPWWMSLWRRSMWCRFCQYRCVVVFDLIQVHSLFDLDAWIMSSLGIMLSGACALFWGWSPQWGWGGDGQHCLHWRGALPGSATPERSCTGSQSLTCPCPTVSFSLVVLMNSDCSTKFLTNSACSIG